MKRLIKNLVRTVVLQSVDSRRAVSSQIPEELRPFPQPGELAVKLNVGGGKGHPTLEDWTVVDLREETSDIKLDISCEPLPFADDSVDVIFTSHTLEHIYPQRLAFVLGEFHRVLKPGAGLLRIAVPDIRKAVAAYVNKDYSFFARSSVGSFEKAIPLGGLLASWFYSTRVFKDPDLRHGAGHVHCFDGEYLAWWLRRVGFRHAWESGFGLSAIEELRKDGLDLHPNDSLFIEAVK